MTVSAPRRGPRQIPLMQASCHGPASVESSAGAPVIALAGAPNSGKSTLFNALTGLRVTTGNWPGTTVDVARGIWRFRPGDKLCDCESCDGSHCCSATQSSGVSEFSLIDLPGAYSLDPMSPDEELTRHLLYDAPPSELPDAVVVAVDAAHLARSLYLVAQLRELELRVIVALTMNDVAARHGVEVDTYALADKIGCPVVAVDPRRKLGLDNLTRTVRQHFGRPRPHSRTTLPVAADPLAVSDERFVWIEDAVTAATRDTGAARVNWSDRIDRWATAPIFGPLIFLVVMWLVFQITTTVAEPLQSGLESFFTGPVTDAASAGLAGIGLGGTWFEGLITGGLISGVGMLLSFTPLMALMFVLLSLLEDSGYMARAAVVTDRMMRSIGLPGKAFLPLVVGFGCNVPAISATRILSDSRQRLLTALLVPFTSCSARLTVYVMIGTAFFGKAAGTVVFIMYLVSILFVVGIGLLLRKTLWRTMGAEPLVLDLPPYQWPTARLTGAVAWTRLKGFLQTASGIIVATVIAVWALQATPVSSEHSFGDVPVEQSAYAAAAKAISPVFAPAGFDSWQTTSALVVGFVAKEAVISSWAQTFAVEEPEEGGQSAAFNAKVHQSFEESSGGHPLPAVAAFLVFLLAYTPCMATLAAQKREIGLGWTLFGIVIQLIPAWLAAVAVFQIGSIWW